MLPSRPRPARKVATIDTVDSDLLVEGLSQVLSGQDVIDKPLCDDLSLVEEHRMGEAAVSYTHLTLPTILLV